MMEMNLHEVLKVEEDITAHHLMDLLPMVLIIMGHLHMDLEDSSLPFIIIFLYKSNIFYYNA